MLTQAVCVQLHLEAVALVELGQRLQHDLEEQVRVREFQQERHRLVIQLRRQLERSAGKHNGAAGIPETLRQLAHPAEDPVVLEVAREILQKEQGVAADQGDVGQRLLGCSV